MIVVPTKGASRLSFQRVKTAGDAQRFAAATSGFQAMLSATATDDTYVLPFPYLVGDSQLMVYVLESGAARQLPNKTLVDAEELAGNISAGEKTAILDAGHFVEVDSVTVDVNDILGTDVIWFAIPHTSVPGLSTNRIIVDGQADRVAIRLLGAGDGLEYTTPDGQKGRLFVTNAHQVVTQKLL